jgi:hypothetical protein
LNLLPEAQQETMAQQQVIRAFFNGTGIGYHLEMSKDELFAKLDNEIDTKLVISTDLLDCIFRETAKIESETNEMAQLHGEGYITEEVYEKMADKNGHDSVADFIHDWFLNVRALLRFGRIQDDENFGFLVIKKSSELLSIEGMGLEEAEKMLLHMKQETEKAEKAKKAEKAEKAEKKVKKNVIFEEETDIVVFPDKINTLQGRFANLGVKTTSKEIQEEMITIRSQDEKTGKKIMKYVYENIVRYTREELIMMDTDDKRFMDWCNDVVIYAVIRQVYYGENIVCSEDENTDAETRERNTEFRLQLEREKVEKERTELQELNEKIKKEAELHLKQEAERAEKAEMIRLQLEREEMEKAKKAEIAKAEKKRKREESEKKAKEASKRNLPPYPPHQKQKSKQDSQMVSNTKAQKEWLKKYVPDWDGLVWSKKQANDYINDIKKGTDVIVCSVVPVAEGYEANEDDCVDLVVAEASLPDFVNL